MNLSIYLTTYRFKLFSRVHMNQVRNNKLPIDAFNIFGKKFSCFVDIELLRKEYERFASLYFDFEKSITLPKLLHPNIFNNDTDSNSESECNVNSNEETTIDTKIFKNYGSILHVFSVCHLSGLKSVFPNVYTALQIACSLPVSNATPERSFSKLKLIKTHLRSTMGQNRLKSLMLMSCESDIDIEKEKITNMFASCSSLLTKKLKG